MALTCLDIITDALNELAVVGIGKAPKAAEAELGLRRLQAIIDGIVAFGIGKSLTDADVSESATLLVDARALVNADAALTLTFPEAPSNGQRIEVIDIGNNFATRNITIDPNGRLIEGAATATLSTNGLSRTWFYIDGNWARISSLALTDILPFGDDEFFTLELAKRLAPVFGAKMSQESMVALIRAANRVRARFSYAVVTPCDDAVRFLSQQSYRTGFSL